MSVSQDDAAALALMLQADGLPGVLLANEPTRHYANQVLTALVQRHIPLYVRHGHLVRIGRKEDGSPYIDTLSETALKGILLRSMNFVKLSLRGAKHVDPPDVLVKDLLALGDWPFAPLDTIVEFPVFRPDGTLLDQPGYDPITRLAYLPSPQLHIPPIPSEPTAEQVVKARALLDEAIGEFPYADAASYANALGLLLTPLIRHAIPGQVPLALIDATRPGTGKSLLAETVAMIATGRKAAMIIAPYDDTEWRKRIASTLAEGATIIVIDNLKAKLEAASLDAALTSSVIKERILGQSKNGVYPQRATWMATGNNIQIGGDLPRRSYWIRMDANMAKPWTRGGFTHDLETWVPAHRGELIAALLTLARAWYAAGQPPAEVPRLGNFQGWATTVGGILAHAWVEGFLGNLDILYQQADEEAAQWAAFLHAWHTTYGEDAVLVARLEQDIRAGSVEVPLIGASLYRALPDELADIHKGDFKRRLGKALARRVGSQFDDSGLHLERAGMDSHTNAVYWRVVGAGVRVWREPMNQKEEHIPPQPSLSGLGSGLTNDLEEKDVLESVRNKPAHPANPQEGPGVEAAAPDPQTVNWQAVNQTVSETETLIAQARERLAQREARSMAHLARLKGVSRVWTPRGTGTLRQCFLEQVWVRMDGADLTTVFEDPEEIEQIIPWEDE